MYLTRFGVKHYKCLGTVDISLTPIHVLIGENDAGKTAVLEAMAALYASAEKPLPEVFPQPWSGRELVLHGHEPPKIEFSGEWTGSESGQDSASERVLRYGFEVDMPVHGNACWTPGEWIESDGQRATVSPPRNNPCTCLYRWKRGEQQFPEQADALADVSRVLRPAHKYALDPRIMAIPAALDPSRKFRLDPDGFGLATLLDDILDYDAERFLRLRTEFCRFFPQFRSVRVESEKATARRYETSGMYTSEPGIGKAIYLETQWGRTVRAQQASDGAILFLGFLSLVHLPDPPTLLLMEEPENGIYPKRLGDVIQLLKTAVLGSEGLRMPQVVITTHSPFLLSFFEPEEVTLLSRPKDRSDAPVRARPLRDAPNIKEQMGGAFFLDEVWYNLTEEELFRDG